MRAEAIIETPVGHLHLVASETGLQAADFLAEELQAANSEAPSVRRCVESRAEQILAESIAQFNEYFAGSRREFDLPLDMGGTPFQQRVWQSIAKIPFGETATYAEIASHAGATNAYRAAGTACGANRIVIAIPCHRVVGSDRGLHGFGGGLENKVWLLEHEGSFAGLSKETARAG